MNPQDAQHLHQATLEAIHRGAVDAIITIDERGIIEMVNPATERLLGYAAEELIGQNVSLLMPSPFREEHDGYLAAYLRGGPAKVIGIGREAVARRKDGSVFPMHLAISEVRVGEHRKFAGFIRDLSDFKQIEQQQASLGNIIENSLNEVYIFRPDSLNFVKVNRGARDNLGYSEEEIERLTPLDICLGADEASFRRALQPLLQGEVEELELSSVHCRQDGSTYDAESHLQLSTYLGELVVVTITLDVSERREAERQVKRQQETMQSELERLVARRTEELRQAQAELVRNEKFATLGKVSGGIAHEIRNPLNAVKTSAYYLLHARQPEPAKVREHLERIDRQVTLIDNVITALSDVARLPDAQRLDVEIPELVSGIVQSVNLPDNVEVAYRWPPNLPPLPADPGQLAIAVRNLLRNARDAMPEGGRLTLSVELGESDWRLLVEDTGVGIPAEHLSRVLEPLFTTKARGMGLGLSITQAIVEKNGGKLEVASQPGQGTQFSMTFPRDSRGAPEVS